MRCAFCGKEIKYELGTVFCEDCNVLVTFGVGGKVKVTDKTPKYITDSIKALHAISVDKPYVAYAEHQLFDKEFDISTLRFIYKKKKMNTSARCNIPGTHITSSTEFPATGKLISMDNYITYNFQNMIARIMDALPDSNEMCVLQLNRNNASKFLWYLFTTQMSTDPIADDIFSAIRLLCAPGIAYINVKQLTNEQALLGYVLNKRDVKFNGTSNMLQSVKEYYRNILNTVPSSLDEEKPTSVLDEDIAWRRVKSSPTARALSTRTSYCTYDPEHTEPVKLSVYDNLLVSTFLGTLLNCVLYDIDLNVNYQKSSEAHINTILFYNELKTEF